MCEELPVLVFSHLRWNFVFQRPQQIMSRLARNRRIYFLEEPIFQEAGDVGCEVSQPVPNVTVVRPLTPCSAQGFCEEQLPYLQQAVAQFVDKERLLRHVSWLYTPMATPLLNSVHSELVVYDCMDELTGFLNAPSGLRDLERALMDRADIVFTGGRSLFEAKRNRHRDVHCFPSSVDATHFAPPAGERSRAADRGTGGIRLGYFGVLDERIDWPLVDEIAGQKPDWTFILIGPVAKVDPANLPRRSNIQYLGPKPYAELPELVRDWDVCLMPFARNDATRFISPTKVLEYFAAEKPVVSTSIQDVTGPYSGIVHIGDSPAQFLQACEAALRRDNDSEERNARAKQVIALTSWERTVAEMDALMRAKREPGHAPARRSEAASSSDSELSAA